MTRAMTAAVLWSMFLLQYSVKAQHIKPMFGLRTCGGALHCIGRRNLTRALVKSGLSGRSSIADLAQIIDRDDDLGLDRKSGRLVYACTGLAVPGPTAEPSAATATPAGVVPLQTVPQYDVAYQHNHPGQLQEQPAAQTALGHRRLLNGAVHAYQLQHDVHRMQQHAHQHRHLSHVSAMAEIGSPIWQPSVPDTPITAAGAFKLHSRPTSSRKIYLDFDGHVTIGTQWNSAYNKDKIVTPAFDKDGNPTSWSAEELSDILAIFRAVSEDYAPFDVDVTTEYPGPSLDTTGIRVAIGGSSMDWLGDSAGGVAWLNSFGEGSFTQPCFAFQKQLGDGYAKYVFEAVSHEVAHTLGLHHDGSLGDSGSAYYAGHGDWAPIMGSAYTRAVSQFSRGEYVSANNKEDDFAIIGQYLPYIPQEHGSSFANATRLLPAAAASKQTTAMVSGVLRHATDADVFSFSAQAGSVLIQVIGVPAWGTVQRSDLNLQLQLHDAAGALLATAIGAGVGPLQVDLPAAGLYYLSLTPKGVGDPASNGFSSYGSRGQYELSLTYTPAH